jgi:hypothetical protein
VVNDAFLEIWGIYEFAAATSLYYTCKPWRASQFLPGSRRQEEKKESGHSTRRKHAHMHTHEGGGVDSKKAGLLKNWSLTPWNEGGREDVGMMGLEGIPAEELESESDRLQLRSSDPQDATP